MGDVQQQLYKLTEQMGNLVSTQKTQGHALEKLERRLDANGAKRWDVWKIVLNAVIAGAVSIIIALLVRK